MTLTEKILAGAATIVLWGCFASYNLNLSISHNECWRQKYSRLRLDYDGSFGTTDKVGYAVAILFGPVATPGLLAVQVGCHQ